MKSPISDSSYNKTTSQQCCGQWNTARFVLLAAIYSSSCAALLLPSATAFENILPTLSFGGTTTTTTTSLNNNIINNSSPAAAATTNKFFDFFQSFNVASTQIDKNAPASTKYKFLNSLGVLDGLNVATKERTQMVSDLVEENPTPRPGSQASFAPLATGTWSVVYAPHIYTMGKLALLGQSITGSTSTSTSPAATNKQPEVVQSALGPVIYELNSDGTMVSHARFDLPWWPSIGGSSKSGWLSVSGTYSSQDDNRICRVDFDKAWIKWITSADDDKPYASLESVPDSFEKSIVQTVGKAGFVDGVSVFPVSYLDDDLIVFDFELLGTRICARKI